MYEYLAAGSLKGDSLNIPACPCRTRYAAPRRARTPGERHHGGRIRARFKPRAVLKFAHYHQRQT